MKQVVTLTAGRALRMSRRSGERADMERKP